MEWKIGTDSYFVRFLGIDRQRDGHMRTLTDAQFPTSPFKEPPAFGGPVHVESPPLAVDGKRKIWGREGNLPFTEWGSAADRQPDPYNRGLNNSKTALEKYVRESGEAVEIYSRQQVDGIISKGLDGIAARLLDEAIIQKVREKLKTELDLLDHKTDELKKLKESARADLLAELQKATDAALARIREGSKPH